MGDCPNSSNIHVIAGGEGDAVIHPCETSYPGKCEISITARRTDDAGAAAFGCCDGSGGVTYNYGGDRKENTRFSEGRWCWGPKTEIK